MLSNRLTKVAVASLLGSLKVLGLLLVMAAVTGTVRADESVSAPEIDPGSMASALTLLTGGLLTLTDRLRRK